MSKLYAFDVDHTLDLPDVPMPGPVKIFDIRELKLEGHIVGVCGNWAVVTNYFPEWHNLFAFVGTFDGQKDAMLRQLRRFIPAEEYVMVGNNPREARWAGTRVSDDRAAAAMAGFRFIKEDDFAEGER